MINPTWVKAAILAGLFSASPVFAQQADPMTTISGMLYNQLGLLQYCQGQGLADQNAIDQHQKRIDQLPAQTHTVENDALLQAGQAGTMSMSGQALPLAEMEASQPGSIAFMCAQTVSAAMSASE